MNAQDLTTLLNSSEVAALVRDLGLELEIA